MFALLAIGSAIILSAQNPLAFFFPSTDVNDLLRACSINASMQPTMDAYNAKLPTLLSHILTDPETQTWSESQVAAQFTQHTKVGATLIQGAPDTFLTVITDAYCSEFSQRSFGIWTHAYVMDRHGLIDPIGGVEGNFQSIEWLKDRWVAILNNNYYSTEQLRILWHVAKQGDHWAKTYTLDLGKWIGIETSFQNDYRDMVVKVGPRYLDPPCDLIKNRQDYYLTRDSLIRAYHWDADHYTLVAEVTTSPIVVLRGVPPQPELYTVEDWATLCEEEF
jgi:hypothetical protein